MTSEEVKAYIMQFCIPNYPKTDWDAAMDKIVEALNRLDKLPPTQPEIILCKDCIWHNEDTNQCTRQICAEMYNNDFCSRAERWKK